MRPSTTEPSRTSDPTMPHMISRDRMRAASSVRERSRARLFFACRLARKLRSEVVERAPQPFLEPDLRLPTEQLARLLDVGLAHLRIVDRQRLEHDLRRRPGR